MKAEAIKYYYLLCILTTIKYQTEKVHPLLLDKKDSYLRYFQSVPYFRAVRYGQTEVVTELLDHGANINAEDNEGISPFLLAIELNYPELAYFLWERGAKIDAKDFKLKTALHHAVERKNLDMVKSLTEICKKLIHAEDVMSHTPVHYAARDDSIKVLEHMLCVYETLLTGKVEVKCGFTLSYYGIISFLFKSFRLCVCKHRDLRQNSTLLILLQPSITRFADL